VDENQQRSTLEWVVKAYDPRQRPWYQEAVTAGSPLWSDIFRDAGSGSLALTAAMPVYGADKQVQAVLGSALRLSGLEDFLMRLKVGRNGQVFIIERNGNIVASSKPLHIFRPGSERQHMHDSPDPLLRATAAYLKQNFTDLHEIKHSIPLEFNLQGARQLLQVTPLFGSGLNWLTVVIVPEADFMEQIQQNTRMTIMLSFLALLIALIVGIVTTRWISQPLLRLNTAAQNLAAGDWNAYTPLDLNRNDEVGELMRAFDTMAAQLRDVFNTLEQKVQERTHDLNEKNEQLVRLNQDKNEFLGIAAHDLKNPLSAIKGLAEEIEEHHAEMSANEVREYAADIRQASEKMFTLITTLLDVNAIESEKLKLNFMFVDIATVAEWVCKNYFKQAQVKAMQIHFHPPTAPCLAYVDENIMQQIFDNLISNAVKYSPPGKQIDVHVMLEGDKKDKIRCKICDQGPGLNASDKQKLFGKFNRLSAKPTGGEHSTGLGLFIVKKLVQAMQGEVWCESEVGQGAVFIVEFPQSTPENVAYSKENVDNNFL
jgi:signal transduction histidine kinase